MQKVLIIAVLLIPQPAIACHHFRYWYYKTPQRCYEYKPQRVAILTREPIHKPDSVIDPSPLKYRVHSEPAVKQLASPDTDYILTLKYYLDTRSNQTYIPDIPAYTYDELQRLEALQKLKKNH